MTKRPIIGSTGVFETGEEASAPLVPFVAAGMPTFSLSFFSGPGRFTTLVCGWGVAGCCGAGDSGFASEDDGPRGACCWFGRC